MKRIAVFCGSSLGTDEIFKVKTTELGQKLAKEQIELVYGGANVGIMGVIANGVLNAGGKAIGVLPNFLKSKEIEHTGLTELILVETMHERKSKISDLCDGYIALPGGFGTMEELFEVLTWGQLNLHQKPVGILNINGFYDDLISLSANMVAKGFLRKENRELLIISEDVDELLAKMKNYKPLNKSKWDR